MMKKLPEKYMGRQRSPHILGFGKPRKEVSLFLNRLCIFYERI